MRRTEKEASAHFIMADNPLKITRGAVMYSGRLRKRRCIMFSMQSKIPAMNGSMTRREEYFSIFRFLMINAKNDDKKIEYQIG
jgi:hypothetical protein